MAAEVPAPKTPSASRYMLKYHVPEWPQRASEPSENCAEGYRLINLLVLLKALTFAVRCRSCGGNSPALLEEYNKRRGFCSTLPIKCLGCDVQHSFMTSHDYLTERGGFSFDVNRRQAFGTLLKGCSRVDIVKFAAAMNMSPPALQKTFDSNIEAMHWCCHDSSKTFQF